MESVGEATLTDIRIARKIGGFAFEFWCSGGDLKDVERLLQTFDAAASEDPRRGPFSLRVQEAVGKLRAGLHIHAEALAKRPESADIWRLPLAEREKMFASWEEQIERQSIIDRTAEIHHRHTAAMKRKRHAYDNINLRSLEYTMFQYEAITV